MTNIDELIWPESGDIRGYSTEQWIDIVQYVLGRLRTFLNLPIDHEPLEPNVGNGFCVNLWNPKPLLGPLALSWKGILGGQVINGGNDLYISATLFLYSCQNRLVTKNGTDFLELVYEKDHSKTGNWRVEGWLKDVHYEYECFDQPA